MALEISGKIFSILPSQSGQGQNGPWTKQNFIIETVADRFPKKVCFLAWNDKAEVLAQLKQGDEVKVAFDLESREYNGRWYTDAKVWKMEVVNQTTSVPTGEPVRTLNNDEAPPPANDDLPF